LPERVIFSTHSSRSGVVPNETLHDQHYYPERRLWRLCSRIPDYSTTMSRATVRAAVASYLAPATSHISFLSNVYSHPAKFTPEGDFFEGQDPGHTTGAVLFLYIGRQHETRAALGGPHHGRKVIEYDLMMDCFIRSMAPQSETAGADSDTFLDEMVAYIRADRNAGNPSVIFQWGEGSFPGSPDIEVDALYPRTLKGSGQVSQVYATIRTKVVEIIDS